MADQCLKGVNWGEVAIDDKNLTLKYNKQSLIRVPLKKILNSNTQKNDIVIQLNTDDCDQNEDNLCEIRFYVPPTAQDIALTKQKQEKRKKEENPENQDEMQEESGDEKLTFQQQLQQEILSKAKIGESTADSILSINDVPLIVPRGKYSLDFFKKSMRFHGSTYQFNIDYQSIQRLFMLPMPDDAIFLFIHLLIDFNGISDWTRQAIKVRVNYIQFNVNLSKKRFRSRSKIKSRLFLYFYLIQYTREKLDEIGWKTIQTDYNGPLYESLCEIISEITGVKVVIPKNFKNKNGQQSLRCSVGPQQGYIFPLEQSMIYIPKPIIQIKHADIKEVIFQRITSTNTNKMFDMKVVSRTPQLFSGIERDELENLTNYFQTKKISVKRIQDESQKVTFQESEEDDEVDEDDSRQDEKKKKQLKKGEDGMNLDSDEDDEDFEVQQMEEVGSGSESSIDDEEDDMEKKPKGKKK